MALKFNRRWKKLAKEIGHSMIGEPEDKEC
jgi:hypothetical protein